MEKKQDGGTFSGTFSNTTATSPSSGHSFAQLRRQKTKTDTEPCPRRRFQNRYDRSLSVLVILLGVLAQSELEEHRPSLQTIGGRAMFPLSGNNLYRFRSFSSAIENSLKRRSCASLRAAAQPRFTALQNVSKIALSAVYSDVGKTLQASLIRHTLNIAGLLIMFWSPCAAVLLGQRQIYKQLAATRVAPLEAVDANYGVRLERSPVPQEIAATTVSEEEALYRTATELPPSSIPPAVCPSEPSGQVVGCLDRRCIMTSEIWLDLAASVKQHLHNSQQDSGSSEYLVGAFDRSFILSGEMGSLIYEGFSEVMASLPLLPILQFLPMALPRGYEESILQPSQFHTSSFALPIASNEEDLPPACHFSSLTFTTSPAFSR
eukprot:gene21595-28595_t